MRQYLSRPRAYRHAAFTCLTLAVAIGAIGLTMSTPSWAGAPEPVVRVEEDWELVLNEPDDSVTAPQFHTVMSPLGNLDSRFAQVTWNYRELPDFIAGGLQIQAWNREVLLIGKSFGSNKMSNTAETVSWTQVLETNENQLSFTIKNGNSTTWGVFGYPANNMKVQGTAGVSNLNAYSPDLSAGSSGISFGSNRVKKFVLARVRYYGPSGLLFEDTTPRVVFELD
jgi:hypothetical protein